MLQRDSHCRHTTRFTGGMTRVDRPCRGRGVAVRATVDRSVFSDVASRKVTTARAWASIQ